MVSTAVTDIDHLQCRVDSIASKGIVEVQKELAEKLRLLLLMLLVTVILLWFHATERKGNIECWTN